MITAQKIVKGIDNIDKEEFKNAATSRTGGQNTNYGNN